MKKKILVLGCIIVITIVVVFLILSNKKVYYTVKVLMVDDHSPDRILEVYDDKNKKIEVQKIEYLDGTLLCNGYNTAVHYGDIENEKEVKIILLNREEVRAKVNLEEVKNK
jgi:hypothetical protein